MKNYSDLKLTWLGEITSKVGYGVRARRILKPLIEGGADIKLIPDEDYLPEHMKIKDPFWLSLIEQSKNKPDTDIRICYCLPTRAKPKENGFNILYSMWETDQYPKQWVPIINSFNIFFTGCQSLVDSAKKAGVQVPIVPINATLDTNEWTPKGPILRTNETPADFVKFLFIGNFIPRKNLEDLLLGFNVAFENTKDVVLTIKTWATGNDSQAKKNVIDGIKFLNSKATGLSFKPKTNLIVDVLSEEQIISLIRGSDAYVSVSKGEAFDLPMVQAMALEKLVVATRFLAHKDYLNDSNSLDVKYTLTPCTEASAPLYDSYQYWSKPDMESYINALRQAYTLIKEDKAKPYGVAARKTIEDNFSCEVNTPKIAQILRSLNTIAPRPNAKESLKKLVV